MQKGRFQGSKRYLPCSCLLFTVRRGPSARLRKRRQAEGKSKLITSISQNKGHGKALPVLYRLARISAVPHDFSEGLQTGPSHDGTEDQSEHQRVNQRSASASPPRPGAAPSPRSQRKFLRSSSLISFCAKAFFLRTGRALRPRSTSP